ncbi:hypothetical protein GCM10023215_09710 [Pseudonocardia yuanmonensis]|uniref:Uncharacterized protein n=1 Tax=Pseudonocardia yuanmonensis TaxID=1095914 RepID=A0ABP8W1I9_9PSEU
MTAGPPGPLPGPGGRSPGAAPIEVNAYVGTPIVSGDGRLFGHGLRLRRLPAARRAA